jgi:hypothetical protein
MEIVRTAETTGNERSSLLPRIFDPSILSLMTEVGLNFFRFMKSLGMSHESNLVVLSSRDNWSYDNEELKSARILVNLRKLNLIKHLDLYLGALEKSLPPDTSFLGCFRGSPEAEGESFRSILLPHRLQKAMGFSGRRWHSMKRVEVLELLEKNGFTTLNIKDINGLTYFISTNTAQAV